MSKYKVIFEKKNTSKVIHITILEIQIGQRKMCIICTLLVKYSEKNKKMFSITVDI